MSRSLPAEVLFVCIETKNYDYGTLALWPVLLTPENVITYLPGSSSHIVVVEM